MRRRDFLHTVLVGSGLAGCRAASGGRGAVQSPDRTAAGASGGVDRGPIIDVHMHCYPADAAIPQLANPVTGKPIVLKDGEAHQQACVAEMKRLNIVKGVVSGGAGDRIAAALRWRDAEP